jgi:hypothetical protein
MQFSQGAMKNNAGCIKNQPITLLITSIFEVTKKWNSSGFPIHQQNRKIWGVFRF